MPRLRRTRKAEPVPAVVIDAGEVKFIEQSEEVAPAEPTVDDLRRDYEKLARFVSKTPDTDPLFAYMKDRKRQAFVKWWAVTHP